MSKDGRLRLEIFGVVLIALCIASCKDDENPKPLGDTFWEKTSLDSVRVLALGSSPNGNLFAGTSDTRSALMRSTDDGRHWSPHSGPAPGFVHAIGFSPIGLGLAATYDGTRSSFMRSVDSDLTWQSVNYSETVFVRTFTFNNAGQIFFGSTGGIYRSTDGGVTWSRVNTTQMSVNAMTVLPNGFLFAGTNRGGFRSTNSGSSWARIELGLPIDAVSATASSAGGVLLASTCGDAVYRSYDYGSFWQSTSLRIPCIGILAANSVGYFFAGKGGNPSMEDPEGMLTSTDGGISWTRINGGLAELDITSFCASSSGHVFVGTGSKGVFRSIKPASSYPN